MHRWIDAALTPVDRVVGLPGIANAFVPFYVGPLAFLKRRRKRYVARAVLKSLSADMRVSAGVFEGLRYATAEAKTSAILPKLVGTYEAEVAAVLAKFLKSRRYKCCVDIGSAEGYYAIGVARAQPSCEVYAVDNDLSALELCKSNALANGCLDRVHLRDNLSADDLASFALPDPSLIISDCEGFERHLFTEQVVLNLACCDLIIEVHDFVDPTIGDHLKQLFSNTHTLQILRSIPDFEKASVHDVPEISQYDAETRAYLLSEFRPCIMNWFVFTPVGRGVW
jgi:predicted O-methyltransferase YrrM